MTPPVQGVNQPRANYKYTLNMRNPPSRAVSVVHPTTVQGVHINGNILKPPIFQYSNHLSNPGQEPLTATMLATAEPAEQKQMLGERLFPVIEGIYPQLAGKITGMLLDIDNSELLHMLEHNESLKAKVDEALAVLQLHQVGTVTVSIQE